MLPPTVTKWILPAFLAVSILGNIFLLRPRSSGEQAATNAAKQDSGKSELRQNFDSLVGADGKSAEKSDAEAAQGYIFAKPDAEALKGAKDRVESALKESLVKVRERYLDQFNALGIPPEKQKELIRGIVEMEEIRIRAGEELRELESRRASYDTSIQEILGEEKYAQYQDYEDRAAPKELLSDLTEFQNEAGLQGKASPEQLKQIEDKLTSVRGGGAFRSDFGPYGSLPKVAVGPKRILSQVDEEQRYLESEAEYLQSNLSDPTLAPIIQSYYADIIQQNETYKKQVVELARSLANGGQQ